MTVDVEGMAARMLDAVEVAAPICPWTMAARAGFAVKVGPARQPAMTLGPVIVVPPHRVERRAFSVAHELAHAALRCADLDDNERTVDAVASAVLLPRGAFARDVADVGADLRALKARHPRASYEAIGRRVAALLGATLTIHDVGPRGVRVRGSTSIRPLERALVLEARASCEAVGPEDMRACPVTDGPWSRVLVLHRQRSR